PEVEMVTRRTCLKAAASGVCALTNPVAVVQAAQMAPRSAGASPAMPGPYRGRVAAVESPKVLSAGAYQADVVQQMMRRGMTALTGSADWTDAWRRFFTAGDVVGIKVNPVGQPWVISDASVLREIIAGLEVAGVKRRDIVVYDRYRDQFLSAG